MNGIEEDEDERWANGQDVPRPCRASSSVFSAVVVTVLVWLATLYFFATWAVYR
jgi:hypothetical protein